MMGYLEHERYRLYEWLAYSLLPPGLVNIRRYRGPFLTSEPLGSS